MYQHVFDILKVEFESQVMSKYSYDLNDDKNIKILKWEEYGDSLYTLCIQKRINPFAKDITKLYNTVLINGKIFHFGIIMDNII